MNQDINTRLLFDNNRNDVNEPIIDLEIKKAKDTTTFHLQINSQINKTPGKILVQETGPQLIIKKTLPNDDEDCCCNIS